MLESRTARWSAGTALLCVLLILITWFLLLAPRRAQAADLTSEQVSAEQSNDVLRTTLAQLQADFADLPATRARLAEIRKQLPPTADLAVLVRTLSGLATSAGVTLVSLSPGAPEVVGGTTTSGDVSCVGDSCAV